MGDPTTPNKPATLSEWQDIDGSPFVVMGFAELVDAGTTLVMFRPLKLTNGNCPVLACPLEEFLTRYVAMPKAT